MAHIDFNDLDPNMDPSILDLKISWKYFKEYARTFIGFIFSGFGITILIQMAITILIQMAITIIALKYIEVSYGDITNVDYQSIRTLMYFTTIPLAIFTFAYFGSVFGLAFDLLSSGSEYTHFSSSFNYFKKYGWQYVVLESIKGFPYILTYIIIIFHSEFFFPLPPQYYNTMRLLPKYSNSITLIEH